MTLSISSHHAVVPTGHAIYIVTSPFASTAGSAPDGLSKKFGDFETVHLTMAKTAFYIF